MLNIATHCSMGHQALQCFQTCVLSVLFGALIWLKGTLIWLESRKKKICCSAGGAWYTNAYWYRWRRLIPINYLCLNYTKKEINTCTINCNRGRHGERKVCWLCHQTSYEMKRLTQSLSSIFFFGGLAAAESSSSSSGCSSCMLWLLLLLLLGVLLFCSFSFLACDCSHADAHGRQEYCFRSLFCK